MGNIYQSDSMQDSSYVQKEAQYVMYIMHHKNYVKQAYEFLKNNKFDFSNIEEIDEEKFRETLINLEPEIKSHDMSKFSDEEFEPYRRNFYPTDEEKSVEDNEVLETVNKNFAEAWKHHYMFNDHHPEHWKHFLEDGQASEKELEIASPMPLSAILHMICDWTAMSYAKGHNNPVSWFNVKAKDEKKCMNPETLKLVSKLLEVLFDRQVITEEE